MYNAMFMKDNSSWSALVNVLMGKKKKSKPRSVQFGDVVCVHDEPLKRYGIWTGENFIQYAKNERGKRIVHEISFRNFLWGVDSFAICEFPKKHGHPTEWDQPIIVSSSVVMPEEKWWRMMEQGWKARRYKLYTPEETVARAKSKLGMTNYITSEHFAMWCKTGIAESHQLERLREWWDMVVVY